MDDGASQIRKGREVDDVGLAVVGCMTIAFDNWTRRAGVQFWYQPHFEMQ